MSRTVLVVAAHADDEVLGMGGTIARHAADGDAVRILFLTDGVSSRGADPAAARRRREAAEQASTLLGAGICGYLDFPDNQLDIVPMLELAKAVEAAKTSVQPDVVYTHHPGDLNVDHRRACEAVLVAFRPRPGERCRLLRAFEVPSASEWSVAQLATPFHPDTWIDVSAQMPAFTAACACYHEELGRDPHARSSEALAIARAHRGRQVGVAAAEAFSTLRRLIGADTAIGAAP